MYWMALELQGFDAQLLILTVGGTFSKRTQDFFKDIERALWKFEGFGGTFRLTLWNLCTTLVLTDASRTPKLF